MFINTIELDVHRFYAQNSKSIIQVVDYVLLYGYNPLLVTRDNIERTYQYEDEGGKYRKYSSGRLSARGIKSRKIYAKDDDNTQVMKSLWKVNYERTIYPTQKPYKLLERIICLGTK